MLLQVESLTKALNEAGTAKEMALHHAAEVDAELQSLKRHAAQISEQLATTMAGRAAGTLSGIGAVIAEERHARAATAAAVAVSQDQAGSQQQRHQQQQPPPATYEWQPHVLSAEIEASVTRRQMPRQWDATAAMPMPVDVDCQPPARVVHPSISAGHPMTPAAGAGAPHPSWDDRGEAPLDHEMSLNGYIRSLDHASSARQQRAASQKTRTRKAPEGEFTDFAATDRPEALFARWDGSDDDSEDVMGVPSRQHRRGGGVKPTNAWR